MTATAEKQDWLRRVKNATTDVEDALTTRDTTVTKAHVEGGCSFREIADAADRSVGWVHSVVRGV